MKADSLGDRMKGNYEARDRHYLARRTPVIVRVDGRAFHTFTRGFEKPFDQRIMNAMTCAARAVCENAQGCKCAYVQSDEASFLLTDYDTLQKDAWFDYSQSKIESIAASLMTAVFNDYLRDLGTQKLAQFDARAFNVPREEVANYFLWRAKDWERNSVSMYCGAFYSAKEMHGQGRADQHEMLHAKGKNWATDLTPQQRNGTWFLPHFVSGERESAFIQCYEPLPQFADIDAVIDPLVNCDKAETKQC